MSKRTAKDEIEYDQHLRLQEDVKTEVIVELREGVRMLLENKAHLLQALIQAQDDLRVYRGYALEAVRAALANLGDCVPGCTKHEWDHIEGWRHK